MQNIINILKVLDIIRITKLKDLINNLINKNLVFHEFSNKTFTHSISSILSGKNADDQDEIKNELCVKELRKISKL